MYHPKTSKTAVLMSATIGCFLLTNSAIADGQGHAPRTRTVDCNQPGASLQKVIDKFKKKLREGTIYIEGFCHESVSITQDGIRLSGNKSGGGLIGGGIAEVTVTGAQRVRIEYLEISGPGYGVLAQEGAAVTVSHNNIHGNEADGIGAYNNVFVRAESNLITGNGRLEQGEAGINASAGGFVRSSGNHIVDNLYSAIQAGNNSYFRSSGGDVIRQKGCLNAELPGEGSSCGDPDTVAVDCYRNAVCDIRGTEVTGFSDISGLANLDARNSSINGDIVGSGGARLNLKSSVTGSGNVYCFSDAFSSNAVQCGGSIPP